MNQRTAAFFQENKRYRYLSEIGSGGAGEVIKAEDLSLNKIIAIKLLSSDYSDKAGMKLQKEATAAGSLNHPNITKIMDFALTADGTPYLVMEYIEGITLSTELELKDKLEPEEAIPIFIQLAHALVYAHQRGITHRDLKPSNIMISQDENQDMQVKLLDFGLAKKQSDSQFFTTTKNIAGSPLYMSPEQAEGKKIESSSDIYSFGCLMYATLAGVPPYRGNTILETLSMHKSRDIKIPYLDTIINDTEANRELARLVFSCMQKEKEDRPGAEQILKTLQQIASGEIAHKSDEFEIEKKKPSHLKTLLLVLLILLPTLVVVLEFIKKPENEEKSTASKKYAPIQKSETARATTEKFTPLQKSPLIIQANPDAKVTDADLAQLEGKKIELLVLPLVGINGTGLKYLKDSSLERLVINGISLSEEGMCCLGELNTIKDLEFISDDVSSAGLQQIKNLKNLQTLKLNCANLSEENLCSLTSLPKLANLEITAGNISAKALKCLSSINSLHRMGLLHCKIICDGENLKPSSSITELDFNQSSGINSRILEAFSKSNISILALEEHHFKTDDFEAIARMPKLQYLNLSRASFNPDDISILLSAPSLWTLKLNGIECTTDSLFKAINKLKISSLHLDETDTTDKQLFSLLKMRTLKEISLESCSSISDQACNDFKNAFKAIWKQDCTIIHH